MAKGRRRPKPDVPVAIPRPRFGRATMLVLATTAVAGFAWVAFRATRPIRPNLVVVTIDTLRADRVGAYGYRGAETPVMDALARRGARFENALTAVPITGPAHATLFTGQYPPVHRVRDNVAFLPDARQPTNAAVR